MVPLYDLSSGNICAVYNCLTLENSARHVLRLRSLSEASIQPKRRLQKKSSSRCSGLTQLAHGSRQARTRAAEAIGLILPALAEASGDYSGHPGNTSDALLGICFMGALVKNHAKNVRQVGRAGGIKLLTRVLVLSGDLPLEVKAELRKEALAVLKDSLETKAKSDIVTVVVYFTWPGLGIRGK